MQLIQSVRIAGLRSIQRAELSNPASLTVLVGKNSSGKSNVLRALNLFFNGEVESGKHVSFLRDHYEHIPRKRTKKRIEVSVDFNLPTPFKLRQGLSHLNHLGQQFTITRTWELDRVLQPQDTLLVTNSGGVVSGGADLARQFLGLISYRYIPNRSVPANLLKEESQAIASSIFSRMKGDTHSAALLSALSNAAQRLLHSATSSLRDAGSPISEPSVATAETLGEMLTMSGFKGRGAHGLPVQDEEWGSGHQAYFLYEVLCTLDTSYGRFFGWRQATIWGVEEPESALHRDLETRLAERLRNWCMDDSYRLQVFLTTHSPVFTMSAENGFWTELEGSESVFIPMSIPELTRAAETRGVGGWVHPILYFPWNPVILTEGPIDADVLTHVAQVAGLQHLRFVSLPNLDPEQKRGGKDKITKFIRDSHGLVHNRAPGAPLFVLFDWEISDGDLKKARDNYGFNGERRVLKMNDAYADPLVGKSFKGIERFYPPKVFLDAHQAEELTLGIRHGKPYSIAASELLPAKGRLKERVLKIDSAKELMPLIRCAMDIQSALQEDHPVQLQLKNI